MRFHTTIINSVASYATMFSLVFHEILKHTKEREMNAGLTKGCFIVFLITSQKRKIEMSITLARN